MSFNEIFQVDAFADRLFSGNPAAVCPWSGKEWPQTELMQSIALENNLSETAFFKPSLTEEADFDLKWFTPQVEIELCGHATLASAFVLFEQLGFPGDEVRFATLSGILSVKKESGKLTLNFPAVRLDAPLSPLPAEIGHALGAAPLEFRLGPRGNSLCVFTRESEIRALKPDFGLISALGRCLLVTAPGDHSDFVSRFFAPGKGVNEDPVTGSAHCVLTPYWAERLGKNDFHAIQVSARQGHLWCRLQGERVLISGHARLFFKGRMWIS